MPDYAQSQLALIDERVGAGLQKVSKMGTVVWWSSGSLSGDIGTYEAGVVLDGSSGTAQPVKCFSSVIIDAEDRVGLVRFEGEWIIVANYTLRTLSQAIYDGQFAASSSTTSASFVDMPGSPTAVIEPKYRDVTSLRLSLHFSMRTDVTGTVVEFGLYVASSDGGTAYDEIIGKRAINEANSHRDFGGWTDAANLPGGYTYSATARWRRVSGTGQLTSDANDAVYVRIEEVVP